MTLELRAAVIPMTLELRAAVLRSSFSILRVSTTRVSGCQV